MDKVVIYGTGSCAKNVFLKVKLVKEVIGFTDSNESKWGKEYIGLPIYSVEDVVDMEDTKILIASTYYSEIINSLLENYEINNSRIMYVNPKIGLIEQLDFNINYKKEKCINRILFVQATPGIRINKIAYVLRKKGIVCDLAYLHSMEDPKSSSSISNKIYNNIIAINDLVEFVNYVNSENYDIVFSSNEPDYLTTLLLQTNKKVVYDLADMSSLYLDVDASKMVHEYIANTYSDAIIYVTENVREIAKNRYDVNNKKTLILNNYVLKDAKPKKYLEKISRKDGEIHCVYEGGISKEKDYLRYIEDQFLKIAEQNIHVHFYGICNKDTEYCKDIASKSKYIHYEGSIPYEQLQTELTKYDIGLVLLNITKRNELFLQTTFSNKIFEYLFAELPVAICDIEITKQFVDKYNVGKLLEFEKDIEEQLKSIKELKIEKNFLEDNKLTMDDQAERIICFLKEI